VLFTVDIMPAGVSGIPVMGGHSVNYVTVAMNEHAERTTH